MKKKNTSLNWALITFALIGITALGYFITTRDSQEIEVAQTNGTEVEEMIEPADQTNQDEVVVIFEDEILENHIRGELDIPTGDITSTDMLDLYSLTISELGVKNLQGLEYALELNRFSLLRENVDSLEPIKNLSSLERLSIRYSTIENLPLEFSENVNLTYVSIVNTPIEDISFLAHMTNIEHLTMSDASIKDISAITMLNNVRQLNLRGNEIEDISALKGKNNLEELNLQSNLVSDVSPLAELEMLDDLVLSFNPVFNLKPLESLPSLNTLVIHLDHDVRHLIFDQIESFKDMGVEVDYSR